MSSQEIKKRLTKSAIDRYPKISKEDLNIINSELIVLGKFDIEADWIKIEKTNFPQPIFWESLMSFLPSWLNRTSHIVVNAGATLVLTKCPTVVRVVVNALKNTKITNSEGVKAALVDLLSGNFSSLNQRAKEWVVAAVMAETGL